MHRTPVSGVSLYRRDIDGLRAVAVLAVLAFHAWPSLLPAGFIGVDVFFVVSGYLISTIILESLERGAFSFAEFYARRVRRIFPALLLVLSACLAFGWFVLLADEYGWLGEHVAASAVFASNFMLWSEAGYFDVASETKPLLHLWSLGIEEQFYIAWPFLLVVAWKKRVSIPLMVAILGALSFGLNLATAGHDAAADFYSPLARFWELLSGCLLAAFAMHRAKLPDDAAADGLPMANCASVLGAALLACGFLCIGRGATFPGAWALLPAGGAVLLIFAGPKAWLNRAILSQPVLVWFGLISYPLYLWHWPLLSFERILNGGNHERSVKVIVPLVAAAIALAWLTYRLVERPVRFGKHGKGATGALVMMMACICAIGFSASHFDGFGTRAAVSANEMIGFSGFNEAHTMGGCGLTAQEQRLIDACSSDNRDGVRYLLLGDSKAKALYGGLVQTSTEKNRWEIIGGRSSHGAPVPILSDEPEYAGFQQLGNIAVDAAVRDDKLRAVVIVVAARILFQVDDMVKVGNYKQYDYQYLQRLNAAGNYDKLHAGLRQAIAKLTMAGKKVIILVDNPALPAPRTCVDRKTASAVLDRVLQLEKRQLNQACLLPLAQFEEETAVYRKLLSTLRSDFPGSFDVFDATDIYCDKDKGICGPRRDGHMLYSYTDHISDYAAEQVGKRLNAFLNETVR